MPNGSYGGLGDKGTKEFISLPDLLDYGNCREAVPCFHGIVGVTVHYRFVYARPSA